MIPSCMEQANYIVNVNVHGEEDENSTWLMLTENARAHSKIFSQRVVLKQWLWGLWAKSSF